MNGNSEQDWRGHWRRWGMDPPEFAFPALRNRVVTNLTEAFSRDFSGGVSYLCRRFDARSGLFPKELPLVVGDNFVAVEFLETTVAKRLLSTDAWLDWVTHLQCLLWSVRDLGSACCDISPEGASTLANAALQAVKEAIDMSPRAPIAVAISGNTGTLYPAGATLLDKVLVEDTLGFLGRHPEVGERFRHALDGYLNKATERTRNLLDDLRFCLEQLLREVLGNQKPLEKQKDPLRTWLKHAGVHHEVVNMFLDLVRGFHKYQNDAVKHGERWSPPEVEFMIYVTGTFMRMVLQLEREINEYHK